jgi:two-component system cell cycle response regulator
MAKNVVSEINPGAEMPDPAAQKDKPVILVIHQDEVVINACRTELEKHGFEIEFAHDGTEGVQKVYRIIPDVVLASSSAPELNGYQICRLIKNDPVMRKIPTLLLADQGLKMDRFWAMKAGADDFLEKDEVAPKLLKKIRMVLEIYDRMDIEEKRMLKASNEKNPFNIRTRLNQILDTSLVESMLMVEFRSLADLVHDPALLNYMLFSLVESIIEYDAAAIFYNDEGKGPRQLTLHLPEGRKQPPKQVEKITQAFFKRFEGRGLTAAQLEMTESDVIGAVDDEASPAEYDTVYFKEVRLDSRLIGVLALYSTQRVDYSHIFPMHLVEDEIRLLMKLRNLYSQAEVSAITDSLTGLVNHRHFMATLQREFKAAKRYQQELSLAVISVDDFRQLNEAHGHACGDETLRHVSKILEQSFRNVDILGRFGGKNLVVLLPKTPSDQARIALERFRLKVSESPMLWRDAQIQPTIGCGLTAKQESTESMQLLIKSAEDALAEAKKLGGNRIEISLA